MLRFEGRGGHGGRFRVRHVEDARDTANRRRSRARGEVLLVSGPGVAEVDMEVDAAREDQVVPEGAPVLAREHLLHRHDAAVLDADAEILESPAVEHAPFNDLHAPSLTPGARRRPGAPPPRRVPPGKRRSGSSRPATPPAGAPSSRTPGRGTPPGTSPTPRRPGAAGRRANGRAPPPAPPPTAPRSPSPRGGGTRGSSAAPSAARMRVSSSEKNGEG